jgi:uncharacterized protein (TIGR02147 family)
LTPLEEERFLALVDAENPVSAMIRKQGRARLGRLTAAKPMGKTLTADELQFIGDWRHGALFEALGLAGCPAARDAQISWLGKRLSLVAGDVQRCLARLERLKLVEQASGTYRRTGRDFATSADVPSTTLRTIHAHYLERAREALESQAFPRRTFNTLLVPLDREQLPLAKQRLAEFCRTFNDEFGRGEGPTDVYCLGLQLYAVTGE